MKKITLRVLGLAVAMLVSASVAQAQFRQSVYLNGELPVGNFAKKVSHTYSAPMGPSRIGKSATVGFGLGYRASYRFDVGMGMVAPFVNADFFWNFIGDGWSDEYVQANAKTPNYFNIPVMLGVSYLYDELWNDITPFAEFSIGADLFIIGSERSDKFIYNYAYKPTFQQVLAWSVGIGSYFGEHVSVGLHYYGLGKHTVRVTQKTYDNFSTLMQTAYDNAAVETRNVGMVALRIGFHL